MSAPRRLGLSSLGLLLAACASVDPAPRDPLDKGEWRSAKSRMYQDLAMQCLKAQDHDRAKQLLQQAIQFDQKDGQTLELLGRLAYAGGDLETASGAARMLLQLDPASVPALCTLGAVAEARHRGDEAEAHYRRALAAGGDDPRPGVDLHRLLLAAGREAEAATLRRQLTARFPRLVEATLDHAAHLAARCEWTEANAAFDEALAAEPGLANAAAGYALSAVMSRRPAAAMALGDRLPPHAHTDNPALVMTLAVARLQAGDYAAALRELDLGPATLKNSAPMRILRGEILFALQHVDAAQAELEQALALDPDAARAHATLGRIHLQQRRHHAAVRCLQRAVQIEPGSGTSHALLAAALASAGDGVGAARHCGIARRLPGTAALVTELERLFPSLAAAGAEGGR